MTKVYTVMGSDYEDDGLDFIAESLESAMFELKTNRYPAPYIVKWGELKQSGTDQAWSIVCEFEAVMGYSTKHNRWFTIREDKVIGAVQESPRAAS